MRPLILAPLLATLILATPAHAANPVLARITLSSGGVGQFEYTAQISNAQTGGPETLPLDVPLDQVDDLLKSLRVDDPAGPPTIRLPGRQPLAESFRTLPFAPDALASLDTLLTRLVGETIRIPGPGVSGTILAVTPFDTTLPNNAGTQTRHRLTLATQTGLESLVLEDLQAIELASPALRDQIATALAAIAAQRVQDRRTLQLTLAPGTPRTIRFGYVVPTPVWKASYRITIPAEDTPAPTRLQGFAPGRLQGFAIVENLSGRDWTAVDVTLTSGQPVLYHQPLYEAVFTTRPEAPVDIANRLTPTIDPGAIAAAFASGALPAPPPPPPRSLRMAAPAAPSPKMDEAPAEPPTPAETRQSAAQVEFHLANPVTAKAGESLMLPIVSRTIPAQRVALYQPGTDPLHPLVALLLTNDTGGALPPGLATLFENQSTTVETYIGDARLPAIQPGEQRLASFAADLPVRIETTRANDVRLTSGHAAAGILTLTRRDRATTTYRVATPKDSGRTLLLEHPKRPGWTLADPVDAASTPTAYRITRPLEKDTVTTIAITLERPRSEQVTLVDTTTPRLLAYAQDGELPQPLRTALAQAATLRATLDRHTTTLKDLNTSRDTIVADQDRIRRNLAAVPNNSELHRRYLAQLQQQENDLATILTQTDSTQRARTEAETALKAYLLAMTL